MTDSFGARQSLRVRSASYEIYRLDAVDGPIEDAAVLAENPARESACGTRTARTSPATIFRARATGTRRPSPTGRSRSRPRASILQDFTGVPAVVDLAAMRDAVVRLGGKASMINPLSPADLVIDHSVQVDHFGTPDCARGEQRDRVRAQPRALRVPPLGAERVSQLPRRAAEHRHRSPGEPRVPEPRRVREAGRRQDASPIPTRSSAPTRTRR